MYIVKYPEWALREVVNADLIDLRELGVNLSDAYTGHIKIDLVQITPGGSIKVGSRRDRERHALQWQYQYPKQRGLRKELIDVWSGMPYARFQVNMIVEMKEDKRKLLVELSDTIRKLSATDLAETKMEMIRARLGIISRLTDDELDVLAGSDPELKNLQNLYVWSEEFEKEFGTGLFDALRMLLYDPETSVYKAIKSFIERKVENNLTMEWGRALLDMRQELLEEKETAKMLKDYKLKNEVKKALRLIEDSNEIANDIFEMFRFYMNTHLACIKYRHDQFWITPIPEWASDSFYLRNEVIMDDDYPIVTVPVYSVGNLVKLRSGGFDNISRKPWEDTTSLDIRRQIGYESGFSSEGIFVKAYEALEDNECEVCVILLKIGLSFGFKLILSGIEDPKEKELYQELSLPDTAGDFSTVMPSWMDAFKKHSNILGEREKDIITLGRQLGYLNHLRTAVEHNKTIIRSYIGRALAGEKGFLKPSQYDISTSIESAHKKSMPYHWRVVKDLYSSSRRVYALSIRFKTHFFPLSVRN